ncbi:MAG TPA: hypothetical protein ENK31_07765 [Nannocystis exedens]|nr:hypothetical protein [Nannocystis exedens]
MRSGIGGFFSPGLGGPDNERGDRTQRRFFAFFFASPGGSAVPVAFVGGATLHRSINDEKPGFRRIMERITIAGQRPR